MKQTLAAVICLFGAAPGMAVAQANTAQEIARLEGLKNALTEAREAFRDASTVDQRVAALQGIADLTTDGEQVRRLGIHTALATGLRSDDDAVVAKSVLLLFDSSYRDGARQEVLSRLKALREALEGIPPPPKRSPVDEEIRRRKKAVLSRFEPRPPPSPDRPRNPLEQRVAEEERKRLLRHVKAADAVSRFAAHLGRFRDDQVADALGPVLLLIMEREPDFADRPARALCQQGRRQDVRQVIDLLTDITTIAKQESMNYLSASLEQSWKPDGTKESSTEREDRLRRMSREMDAGEFLPKWTLAFHGLLMDLARERGVDSPAKPYKVVSTGLAWQKWFNVNRKLFPRTLEP